MLLQFRKLTRGAIATIILGLVGLAMVVFLVPNMDIGQFGGRGGHLAEVAGRKIAPLELSRELDARLREARSRGATVTERDAIEAGEHTRLLEDIITRHAAYAHAEKLGVSASDTQVAEAIRQLPALINPVTGAFDQSAYARLLQQVRYSQPEFEERIRNDISRQIVRSAMLNGVRPPSSFGALVFTFQTETRTISIADAGPAAVGAIGPATDAQLQTLWQETQDAWRVPEYRTVTLVYARPQDFVARVNVPEERLRQEFEARRAAMTTPERRSYVRISAPNQAQANDAAARLGRGESPDAIATALGVQATRGVDEPRNAVPDRRVADAVFSQPRGAVRVVQGMTWAAVRVDAITPASEPRFEDQREELRLAIANEEAGTLLNTAIGAFDDARGAGASVADAARQAGLPFVTLPAVDEEGRDAARQPVAAFAGQQGLLEIAFETPEGEASDFTPAGEADVVIAVDRITPSTVRPMAQVRSELAQGWVVRERARRMRELGAEFVAAVDGGQSFAEAARAKRFNVRVNAQAIDRQTAERVLGPELAAQAFGASQGDVVTVTRPDGGVVAAVQVNQINRVDPATAPQAVEEIRARLEQDLTLSLNEAAEAQIVARARPRRNEPAIERAYPDADAEQAQ